MSTHSSKQKHSAKDVVIPLLIGMLGVVAVVLAAAFGEGFQTLDVVLLMIVVAFAAVGYTQRVLRGLMTIPFLYIATGVAATLYTVAAPYIGAPFGDYGEVAPPPRIQAISFGVLVLVIWIPLEAIARSFLKDTSLPGLLILDNFGGVLIYAFLGVVVAALIYNTIGFGSDWQGAITRVKLRSLLTSVMRIFYATQAFWFPPGRPRIYTAGLR
jgi:uncharacterized membrane protein required for colicin V production